MHRISFRDLAFPPDPLLGAEAVSRLSQPGYRRMGSDRGQRLGLGAWSLCEIRLRLAAGRVARRFLRAGEVEFGWSSWRETLRTILPGDTVPESDELICEVFRVEIRERKRD